jgi:tRNA(fMet)-specific endonuclease VapC
MKYLLDTNFISNLIRPRPSPLLIEHIKALPISAYGISAMTVGELLFGALRAPDLQQKYLAPINELVKEIKVVAFDEKAARRYAEIRAFLTQSGQPIGDADTQIASIALARKLILVTQNVRHFARIPQLTIENWIDQ